VAGGRELRHQSLRRLGGECMSAPRLAASSSVFSAHSSPPHAATMASDPTPEAKELALVAKVEMRIALASSDKKLAELLNIYLAPLLLKLGSDSVAVRNKVRQAALGHDVIFVCGSGVVLC